MDECYFPLYLAKFLISELEEKGTNLNNNLYNACREIGRLNAEVDRLNEVIEEMKGKAAENNLSKLYETKDICFEDTLPVCCKCRSLLQQVRPGKWQCPECG